MPRASSTPWLFALSLAGVVLTLACRGAPAVSAERVILEREFAGLSAYRGVEVDRILESGDLLVVLDQGLIGHLLQTSLPVQRVVAERYDVRLERADVTFRTGLALVEFEARVSLVDRPTVFVDATVYGMFEVLALDTQGGMLHGRVEMLAVEANEVGVGGWSAPARRLATEIARRRGEEFNDLVGTIQIPIALEHEVRLPEVTDSAVTLESATIPLTVAVSEVLAGSDRLWIVLDAAVAAQGDGAGTDARRGTRPIAAGSIPPGSPELFAGDTEALRRAVAELRIHLDSELARQLAQIDESFAGAAVAMRVRVGLLQELLRSVASHYLDDVRIHLRPGRVAQEGARVNVRLGPIRPYAGRWDLEVSIDEVEATLSAGDPELRVESDDRVALRLPVQLAGGTGTARLDFRWDAALLVGAVCAGFEINETFAATVSSRPYELAGHFVVAQDAGGIVLRPVFRQRLEVAPEPTEASWARVREILESQDKIFRCGLALDPDSMETRLRDVLRRGFRFRLPDNLLQPVSLPLSISHGVEVEGRLLEVAAVPAGLSLTPEWLWYGVAVELALR